MIVKYHPSSRKNVIKEKIVPKKCNFWPKLPPPVMYSAGFRLKSEALTTHKV